MVAQAMTTELITWIAIVFCVSQSAMFSGLNLAFFSLSRLRLEVEASAGNANAARVLALRSNPNGLLPNAQADREAHRSGAAI